MFRLTRGCFYNYYHYYCYNEFKYRYRKRSFTFRYFSNRFLTLETRKKFFFLFLQKLFIYEKREEKKTEIKMKKMRFVGVGWGKEKANWTKVEGERKVGSGVGER